jgi:hypothetical protein
MRRLPVWTLVAMAFTLASSPRLLAQSPPVCVSGGPYVAECTGPLTPVPHDGSGSFDPDGTPISVLWFEECAFGFFDDPTSLTPNYIIDMTGVCARHCGPYELQVTSGGQTTKCQENTDVSDTTPPDIVCPADVQAVWGACTDPSCTGSATATDACNPSPTVSFSDTIIPQAPGSNIEQTIIRTWVADDGCQQSSCQQTIELFSPSTGVPLQFNPGTCNPTLEVSVTQGLVDLYLAGSSNLAVTQIDTTSLKVSRFNEPSKTLKRMMVGAPQDTIVAVSNVPGVCNNAGQDGWKDLKLTFSRSQFINVLELAQQPSGTQVQLVVIGRRLNGSTFIATNSITVQ